MEHLEVPLLLQRARGLVKIHGLNPETDDVHRQVWSALTEGRPDVGVPLQYQLVTDSETIFPPRKEKVRRQSVVTDEDFVPNGILKSNWVQKHKEAVPSVVVIFFDLEWQAENWATRESECADLINGIRNDAKGRYTRLVAVLLQSNPLPDGDPLVEERAVSLRNACQLKTRSSLFALPSNDAGLKGMVIRLESAFFELSVKYYEQSELNVKQQIDALSHATETVLATRYLFKCGYFCELRQQRQLALKSYVQLYSTLRDTQGTGVPLAEIKSVAGLVLAKICQLHFAAQKPKDALSAFRDHMKVFGSREGRRSMIFRHYAWLAEQRFLFAHVFEEAVEGGLAATPIEHPGHYYFRAAEQVRRWKDAGSEALQAISAERAGVTATVEPPEYVGQTNVTLHDLPQTDTPAADLEVLKLSLLEKTVNHASIIVEMCDKAIVRFCDLRIGKRKVSCRRSLCMINAVRARELVELGKHQAALDGVVAAIDQFRADKWFELLGHTVEFAARASYEMRDLKTFLMCVLEMSSTGAACLPEPTRTAAHESFTAVLSGKPPAPPAGTATADAEWTKHLENCDGTLEINMDDFRHAVDCKVCVQREILSADEDACVYFLFYSTLAGTVRLQGIGAAFAGEADLGKPVLQFEKDVDKEGFELPPRTVVVVKATVLPCATIAEDVICTGVSVSIGDGKNAVQMLWATEKLVGAAVPGFMYPDHSFCVESVRKVPWASIPTVRHAKVNKLASRVSIDLNHRRPALVGERYEIIMRLTSEETVEMTDVQLSLSVLENGEACPVVVDEGVEADGEVPRLTTGEWDMGSLAVGASSERTVRLLFDKVSGVDLTVGLTYKTQTTTSTGVEQVWDHTRVVHEVLQATQPITCTMGLETLQRDLLPSKPEDSHTPLLRDEPLLLQLLLTSNVPWSLDIVSITLHETVNPADPLTNSHPRLLGAEGLDAVSGVTLRPAEELAATACVGTSGSRSTEVPLGYVAIQFRRTEGGDGGVATTILPLPTVQISSPTISVHAQAPPVGQIRQPLRVTYTLKNHSSLPQNVVLEVEKNRLMIFSGFQKLTTTMLPGDANADGYITPSSKVIEFVAFPLEDGFVPLPRPKVSVRAGESVETVELIHGPSTSFIKGAAIDKEVPPRVAEEGVTEQTTDDVGTAPDGAS